MKTASAPIASTRLLRVLPVLLLVFCFARVSAATPVSFTDTFTPAASAQWNNYTGNWTATGGQYAAQVPNNNPLAVSQLPYDVTDASVTVTVNNLGDGGILLHSDGTNQNGVLLVLGGAGYGQGQRGGAAGNAIYWSTITSGNATGNNNEVNGVFTPGQTYTLTATVVGNTYSAYINGSNTPITTFTTSAFPHGTVGLYDDQPNTTTGSGSGPAQTFSNFSLTGTLVPEPATLSLAALSSLALFHRRKRTT